MVQQIATAHFRAWMRSFVMSETRIDSRPLDEDYLRAHRAAGEPYWRD